jgi:hypothetical protein
MLLVRGKRMARSYTFPKPVLTYTNYRRLCWKCKKGPFSGVLWRSLDANPDHLKPENFGWKRDGTQQFYRLVQNQL